MAISPPFSGSAWARALVILIASQFLRAPANALPYGRAHAPIADRAQSADPKSFRPMETLKTPLFWVMYVMFVLVASGGLVVTAQFASIAADYGVAKTHIALIWASPARC